MDVILGTDSLLTGDGDILDELRFARGRIDDERLIAAVGSVAARRFGIPEPSLMPGARADLVVLRRPLLEASFADVALVVAAGKLRVLDPALLPRFPLSHGSMVTWRGAQRWISGQIPNTYCTMMPMV
jgi:imidazolonepropionase-like amidohydrolase